MEKTGRKDLAFYYEKDIMINVDPYIHYHCMFDQICSDYLETYPNQDMSN